MTKGIPYYFVAAFSADSFAGNPAAVVFLQDDDLDTATLKKMAENFNQPITSIVYGPRPSSNAKVARFSIRWFSPLIEVPLCGHGTIAAAKAVLERPGMVHEDVESIEFETKAGIVMRAKKVEGGMLEIQLPSAEIQDVSDEERSQLTRMLEKAFGRKLAINYVGKGGTGFEHLLMVELDASEMLEHCKVDANALVILATVRLGPAC
jgi:PhzF family phenazine biosynthesis protein